MVKMEGTGVAVLIKEVKYYKDHLEELIKHHEGSFVLISDSNLRGAYTTEAEAYEAGVKEIGNKPFLIRRVAREGETAHFPALGLSILHADT